MLYKNVTEMNLSTHWPRKNASAADRFSAFPSQQMEAAGAPCTASCRPHFAFRAPSMCGLLQEIRTAFTAHCLTIQHQLANFTINRIYSNSPEYFLSLNMQADGRTLSVSFLNSYRFVFRRSRAQFSVGSIDQVISLLPSVSQDKCGDNIASN